jgi:ribosomal protein S18 acetylase RimI-like enzyme
MARMLRIRPAGPADGLAIARIRAESWRKVYAGVIPDGTLAERTSPAAVAREGEWRSAHPMDGVLIAETPSADGDSADGDSADGDSNGDAGRPGAGDGADPAVIGFAAFGPERGEGDEPGEPQEEPPEHGRAELYAIYVVPGRWSTGAGRELMGSVLRSVADAGYTDISLWVLEANGRARRFYERAGFQLTGESVVLGHLGGVTEVRYRRLVS